MILTFYQNLCVLILRPQSYVWQLRPMRLTTRPLNSLEDDLN